jgi:hypothetical protein
MRGGYNFISYIKLIHHEDLSGIFLGAAKISLIALHGTLLHRKSRGG